MVSFVNQQPPVSPTSPTVTHKGRERNISISAVTDADADGEDAMSHEISSPVVTSAKGKGKERARDDSPLVSKTSPVGPSSELQLIAKPDVMQKVASTSASSAYMAIGEAGPSTFHLFPTQFADVNPRDITLNDAKFEGYDTSGLNRVCHQCRGKYDLYKMQCWNPQADRTYCNKQFCRSCINEW
jgi:hypothetical protein